MAGRRITQKQQCIIEGCLKTGDRGREMCVKHWTRWTRHADPFWKDNAVITKTVGDTVEERFWSRVDKTPGFGKDGDCWEWIGMPSAKYGEFSFKGRRYGSHRFALELRLGRSISEGLMACHTCDNTRCVRPDHLFEGTPLENMQDMWAKGRANPIRPYNAAKGAKVRTAKLTDDKVLELRKRRRNKEKLGDLALAYDITVSQVWQIASGRSWKHLL